MGKIDSDIDWNEAVEALKRDVREHGGFLTMQKDTLRERFGITRLKKVISRDLTENIKNCGMIVRPDLYHMNGKESLRVYDTKSDIWKIARAVLNPQIPEKALVHAVNLYERANDGEDRRSVDVPWLKAFEVFLQFRFGRPPEDWEDLNDEREPYQLVDEIAKSLGLACNARDKETFHIARAVCACRPRGVRLDCATRDLNDAITEAAKNQKEIFDGVLREAAKHLLDGKEIPSQRVELGRLGLRYRHETQGGME